METKPGQEKVFRIRRFTIGLNVLVQLLVLILILGMINYLAFNHYRRWDNSRDRKYALSEQTVRLLKTLKKRVKAIVFFSPTAMTPEVQIYPDVENLLKEFQYGSKKKIEVEFVNPARDFARARDLQAKYKFGRNENIVILDYDGRNKVVNATDMAEFDQGNLMIGQPPQLKSFKGEQAITSALLEIVEEKQNKLYVLTGHSEPGITDESISGFKAYLERQNLKLEEASLMSIDAVPPDAKGLVILSPKYDFTEREMKLLKEYWERNGRIFLAIDPNALTARLTAFLQELGVKPENNRILRTVALGPVTGIVTEAVGTFAESNPVTKRLKGAQVQFGGQTQALTIVSGTPGNTRIERLIRAAEGFWGESEYTALEESGVFFDPKKDQGAPLNMAVSIEKGALNDTRVQVDSSRMVVVGNGSYFNNEVLTEPGVDFTLAALNWLLDREELIGITPKEPRTFVLNLSDEQVRNIAVIVMFGIPSIVAILGFGAYASRRR
jgi:hypothetical protein